MAAAERDLSRAQGAVRAAYIEVDVHNAEVARLQERIRMLESRPPLTIVEGAGRVPTVSAAEPAEEPPPPPPPRERPCRCRGMFGSTCPICAGTGKVTVSG